MKKIARLMFTFGLLLILTGVILIRKDSITTLFNIHFSSNNTKFSIKEVNEYYRDYDFLFVQNISGKVPSNYQDLLNIYYTIINSGKDEFTFYCPKNEYTDCISDIESIANNQTLLSNINNYVHPYNAFSHIETEFDSLGKVTITIERHYSKDDIKKINEKVEEIFNKIYNDKVSPQDNIKAFHNYIIENTKYDSDRSDKNIIKYRSDTAYGPLFEGYAICGGYTDLMELFLEKMNLKSYKVSSYMHIWNVVKINDKWYHIDLTWDDPVLSDGTDSILHDYMLIDTSKLLELEKSQHNFNQDIFLEVKEVN